MALDQYDELVISHTPWAYYPMDETTGTVMTDQSGNARNGSYLNAPVLASRTFTIANGLEWVGPDLNGTNQYAQTPAFNNTGWAGLTYECWIILDVQLDGTGIMSNIFTSNPIPLEFGAAVAAVNGNVLNMGRYDGSAWTTLASASIVATLGTIHHFVATVTSGGAATLWYDNTKIIDGAMGWSTDTDATYIGRRHDDAGGRDFVDGTIAKAAIYDRALTATEIGQHWDRAHTLPGTPLWTDNGSKSAMVMG